MLRRGYNTHSIASGAAGCSAGSAAGDDMSVMEAPVRQHLHAVVRAGARSVLVVPRGGANGGRVVVLLLLSLVVLLAMKLVVLLVMTGAVLLLVLPEVPPLGLWVVLRVPVAVIPINSFLAFTLRSFQFISKKCSLRLFSNIYVHQYVNRFSRQIHLIYLINVLMYFHFICIKL